MPTCSACSASRASARRGIGQAGHRPGGASARRGIGQAVAFSIRLEVDDVSRFETDRQFFIYCRLVPGADNSSPPEGGEGDRVRHKRSRDGNRYLKIAFSHAAVRAMQYYPEIRDWYKMKRRRKPEAVARALVAKEIARIVYHVLRKGEDFNGQFCARTRARASP